MGTLWPSRGTTGGRPAVTGDEPVGNLIHNIETGAAEAVQASQDLIDEGP